MKKQHNPPIKIPWPSLPKFPEPYNEQQRLVREIKNMTAAIEKAEKFALLATVGLNLGAISEDAAVEFISEARVILEELTWDDVIQKNKELLNTPAHLRGLKKEKQS